MWSNAEVKHRACACILLLCIGCEGDKPSAPAVPQDKPSLQTLMDLASHGTEEQRVSALEQIGLRGADGLPAAPLVYDMHIKESGAVRQAAVVAYTRLWTKARCRNATQNDSPETRAAAVQSLGLKRFNGFYFDLKWMIAEYEADALPAVCAAMDDPSDDVRKEAVYAIWRFGDKGLAAAEGKLVKALDDTSTDVRIWGAHALGELGSVRSVPDLIRMLDRPAPAERKAAAEALGRLGRPAAGAVSALKGCMRDTDAGVRAAAREAIELIEMKERRE